MHLQAVEWSGSGSDEFVAWIKQNIAAGRPTIVGVFMNQFSFYGTNSGGYPDYDHIVPFYGAESSHAITDPSYYTDDVLLFSDNGLYTPSGPPIYLFSGTADALQLTRAQANLAASPTYSIPTGTADYGVAIAGVTDPNGETLPVRVATSVNFESPEVHGNTRPAGSPLALTVTVSGLQTGVAYTLYRYSSFAVVPDSSFNASASNASTSWSFVASGGTFVATDQILSSDVAVYRAVPSSGP